jgi:hypothetical protein
MQGLDSCILYLEPLVTGRPPPSGVPKIQNNFLELDVYVFQVKGVGSLTQTGPLYEGTFTKLHQSIFHNILVCKRSRKIKASRFG